MIKNLSLTTREGEEITGIEHGATLGLAADPREKPLARKYGDRTMCKNHQAYSNYRVKHGKLPIEPFEMADLPPFQAEWGMCWPVCWYAKAMGDEDYES